MKINEYEIKDIIKRIYRLQLKFYKLCRKLGKFEVDKTPFGDYLGDIDKDTVIDNMVIKLSVGRKSWIKWKVAYYDIILDYPVAPDIYEGSFDLEYMKEFDFKKVALEYFEIRERDLKREIDSNGFQIEECNRELDTITKIKQKWEMT